MTISRTSLANRALDIVGKDTLLDLDNDTSPLAKIVQRNFEPVFKRCLRKADWPWAIKRVDLNPLAQSPLNEFTFQYQLPPETVKIVSVFPRGMRCKIENDHTILCDESYITVRIVTDAAIQNPSVVDPSFAEYFSHELAVALSYKFTDSVQLRNEIRSVAKEMFAEAAGLFSQEDTDDPMPESPWITDRVQGTWDDGSIRIQGLE